MRVVKVAAGIHWVDIPKADLRILCGCPADAVKHLMKRGLVVKTEINGTVFETGPNAILLSDVSLQNGEFSNLAEFPVLQMLYRQGMILPGHPNNEGAKPILIGLKEQVEAQFSYIYRGNYGLISQEELEAAGVPADQAKDWMRIKLRFAFGKIRTSDELLESCIVGEGPAEVKNGVTIRRLDLNIFELRHGDDVAVVNLNLGPGEAYETPYPLNYHNLRREYFAVVHSGEGDGWDVNRPTMSSVLMFQGKIFLIDAGPNLHAVLKALGISINEIEGIFHTHSHDDHFCGLTTLIRADRRIRYFAVPAVRAAVTKKLAALMSIEEKGFEEYFEICDLELDQWNHVEGLDVRPIFSPHPVETSVFLFRALSEDDHQTYAHFGDIISFDVLDRMTTDDPGAIGIPRGIAEKVRRDYLEPAQIKKIDVGGGLIHGCAEDFATDASRKIILSHTDKDLTNAQRMIGSGAPFGTVDILIPSARDYTLRKAHSYLTAYFPDVPRHDLEMLLNRPIQDVNAETIVLRQGERCEAVVMPLTGLMEAVNNDTDHRYLLSSGTLIGESACLDNGIANKTYRAASFVKAIMWPADLYRAFIRHNNLLDFALATASMRAVFARSWLFGENISVPVINQLVRAASTVFVEPGQGVDERSDTLFLVRSGSVERRAEGKATEVIKDGDFFGEAMVLHGHSPVGAIFGRKEAELLCVSGAMLRDIPIVRWKLFETHLRRLRQMLAPGGESAAFTWHTDYAVGVPVIDRHHQKLFDIANKVMIAIDRKDYLDVRTVMMEMIEYNDYHFREEIRLLEEAALPDVHNHEKIHEDILEALHGMMQKIEYSTNRQIPIDKDDFRAFFQDLVIDHIFKEDRKYARFLYN